MVLSMVEAMVEAMVEDTDEDKADMVIDNHTRCSGLVVPLVGTGSARVAQH